jgi:hypothetical protein
MDQNELANVKADKVVDVLGMAYPGPLLEAPMPDFGNSLLKNQNSPYPREKSACRP